MDNVLTVKGLKKSYGNQVALAGIDFEVRPGEVFALIGPNGAGKTTTLRIIATLLTLFLQPAQYSIYTDSSPMRLWSCLSRELEM